MEEFRGQLHVPTALLSGKELRNATKKVGIGDVLAEIRT
jgi:hypothetical protein